MLRVMIIGCGGIAPKHINGFLSTTEDAVITHLIDPLAARAQSLINEYHLDQAIASSDYKSYLDDVDVVSICTPPGTHCEIAVSALEHGCHVLLEKPMAPSLEECDKIMDAAKKSGKLCSVVVQSRFISERRNVIEIVKSGAYGKNRYTRVNSVWHRGESYYHLGWRGRWLEEGGGCTLNHSIHHIDLLLYAKGMPASIRSFMTNLAHHNSEEEDFSSSVLRYSDGSIAEITSTLVAHGDHDRQALSFDMEDASITIPFAAYASKPMENGFPQVNEKKLAEIIADYQSRPQLALESHDGQVENFLRAISGKEELIATAQDGRNCIELITGVYQSAITDREVSFPIAKDSPYYTSEWRKDAPHFYEKQLSIDAFASTKITSF